MYNVKISKEDLEALRRGHTPTILKILKESDATITKELKTPGSNTAFLQGASCVIDRIIHLLN